MWDKRFVFLSIYLVIGLIHYLILIQFCQSWIWYVGNIFQGFKNNLLKCIDEGISEIESVSSWSFNATFWSYRDLKRYFLKFLRLSRSHNGGVPINICLYMSIVTKNSMESRGIKFLKCCGFFKNSIFWYLFVINFDHFK